MFVFFSGERRWSFTSSSGGKVSPYLPQVREEGLFSSQVREREGRVSSPSSAEGGMSFPPPSPVEGRVSIYSLHK
jgi:hypothetical protein